MLVVVVVVVVVVGLREAYPVPGITVTVVTCLSMSFQTTKY